MQIPSNTPAESLLHRLLCTEKLHSTYRLFLHEEEHFTDVFVQRLSTEIANRPAPLQPAIATMP